MKRLFILKVLMLLCLTEISPGLHQKSTFAKQKVQGITDADELLLSFNYPSVGRVFIMGRYDYQSERLFLPVLELFNMLGISAESSREKREITGIYLIGGESYVIRFDTFSVKLGEKSATYSADMMTEGSSDYYMALEVFEEMFGMMFTYNLSNLSVSLDTPHVMPVVENNKRMAARENLSRPEIERAFYPLIYGRDRSFLTAGYIDYSLGIINQQATNGQDYSFQFEGGIEALGGQLTARNSFGHSNTGGWYQRSGNIRWKYSVREMQAFSSVEIGQVSTAGLHSQQINGIRVTNEPVESLQLYGETVLDGRTEPDSEVELFLNNELLDFTLSDAQGYYRFNVPLRYGASRLRIQAYTPDGRLIVNEKEIQIPFSFQRKGDLIYNVQAGFIQNDGVLRASGEKKALNADINYGVSNWLTTSAGLEYNDIDLKQPAFYSRSAVRILQQYLVNVDLAPSYFYRAQSSTVFNRDRSLSAAYTYFDGNSRFNQAGARHQLAGNIYTPLPVRFLNAGFRLSVDYTKLADIDKARIQSDLFTQIGPFNVRLNYKDRIVSSRSNLQRTGGTIGGAVTYKFNRRSGLRVLAGSFLRSSVIYNRTLKGIQQYDLQLSKSLFRKGQLNIGYSKIVASGQSYLQVGFNLDFKGKVRSSSTARTDFSNPGFMQTFRGSLGYDEAFDEWQTSDRRQVGKSGASVVLFIDNDNDGSYSDADEIIPYPAVKLDRPAQIEVSKKGIVRLSQLQSNYRYNLKVDRSAIPNPLYVPVNDKFSFIADPNQFKTIEIPFYPSGVIEGMVSKTVDGETIGVGGLRLTVRGTNNEFEKTIRTFRDGTFYSLDIPPGVYSLTVDAAQLEFLNAKQTEVPHLFTIEAKADGDYLDDLKIILISKDKEPDRYPAGR